MNIWSIPHFMYICIPVMFAYISLTHTTLLCADINYLIKLHTLKLIHFFKLFSNNRHAYVDELTNIWTCTVSEPVLVIYVMLQKQIGSYWMIHVLMFIAFLSSFSWFLMSSIIDWLLITIVPIHFLYAFITTYGSIGFPILFPICNI